jgi:hypothetical protein
MNKTSLFAQRINKARTFELCSISSLSIANWGASEMLVTVSNVTVPVPPFDKLTMLVPVSWNVDGDGALCDYNVTVEFEGGEGDAVLYYKQTKK